MARKKRTRQREHDRRTVLASVLDPTTSGFDDAWVGMEPTFQSAKSVRKWRELSEQEGGEDAYFLDDYMLRTLR
jgi:hypothetical protein